MQTPAFEPAWRRHLIAFVLLVFFAAWFLIGRGYTSDAKLFPMIVGALGVLAAATQIALSWRAAPEPEEAETQPDPEAPRRVRIALLAAPLFGVVVYVLGFQLATVLTMIAMPWALGFRSIPALLAIAAATVVLIQLVFGYGMDMELPHGLLGEWVLRSFIYED